jgi:hypothetical protein
VSSTSSKYEIRMLREGEPIIVPFCSFVHLIGLRNRTCRSLRKVSKWPGASSKTELTLVTCHLFFVVTDQSKKYTEVSSTASLTALLISDKLRRASICKLAQRLPWTKGQRSSRQEHLCYIWVRRGKLHQHVCVFEAMVATVFLTN